MRRLRAFPGTGGAADRSPGAPCEELAGTAIISAEGDALADGDAVGLREGLGEGVMGGLGGSLVLRETGGGAAVKVSVGAGGGGSAALGPSVTTPPR